MPARSLSREPARYNECQCGATKDRRAKLCLDCRKAAGSNRNDIHALRGKLIVGHENGCWEFDGQRLPKGYGLFAYRGKKRLAHRISWLLHRGEIPRGMLVCHKCDNPPCVNPAHLFLGTIKDNSADMVAKGRAFIPTESPKTRGSRHWACKFTAEQVAEIRRRSGEPRAKLAAEFGTTARYISSIICGHKRKYGL